MITRPIILIFLILIWCQMGEIKQTIENMSKCHKILEEKNER